MADEKPQASGATEPQQETAPDRPSLARVARERYKRAYKSLLEGKKEQAAVSADRHT